MTDLWGKVTTPRALCFTVKLLPFIFKFSTKKAYILKKFTVNFSKKKVKKGRQKDRDCI